MCYFVILLIVNVFVRKFLEIAPFLVLRVLGFLAFLFESHLFLPAPVFSHVCFIVSDKIIIILFRAEDL